MESVVEIAIRDDFVADQRESGRIKDILSNVAGNDIKKKVSLVRSANALKSTKRLAMATQKVVIKSLNELLCRKFF